MRHVGGWRIANGYFAFAFFLFLLWEIVCISYREIMFLFLDVIHELFLWQQYCSLSGNLSSTVPGDLHAIPHGNAVISLKKEQIFHQEAALGRANLRETVVNTKSSNGRVMLIDGTSVIYRAYYKLLGNSCRSCFLIFCKGFCFHHIGSTVPFVFFFSAASLRCFLVAACFLFLVSMGKLFCKLNMNKTKGLGI